MDSISSGNEARRRRRVMNNISSALRDLRAELSGLNHRVGAHVDLKDGDLECLDLLDRHGTLSPSALARRAGVHPATMTGVLDRLERGGWISRDRTAEDRRAVVVRPIRKRAGEMLRLYSGMNTRLRNILGRYSEAELAVIADFLHEVAEAGRRSADDLAAQQP